MFRIIIVLPFVTIISVLISCSSQPTNNKIDSYYFPIKPGSAEWANFRSHAEMLEVCQVPESILKTMSTEGLVETVLNYPLRIDTFAYNDPQTGFDAVATQFNGIKELLNREDAATELLAQYKTLDLSVANKDWEPKDRGEYTLGTVAFTEILMAQYEIINKMTEIERINVLSEAIKKNDEKHKFAEFYGQSGQAYTIWIMARVLKSENYAPFIQMVEENDNFQWFLSNCLWGTTDLMNAIISIAQEYLSQT